MARKRKEMTGADLIALLERIDELANDVEAANDAIDNHIPKVEIWDGYQSQTLWLGIHLSKLAMRLQTVQRCWEQEKQWEALEARRKAASAS